VRGCDWHIILVRGMSLVFVGLSTYRTTAHMVGLRVGATGSGYAARCTG
jgi:hypothetical protein